MIEAVDGLPFGASVVPEGVRFRVWSPGSRSVEALIERAGDEPRVVPLTAEADGYFSGVAEGVGEGALYRYRIDGGSAYPDPASRFQPQGVHGPSAVVDPQGYRWGDDAWEGLARDRLVIYELHVGTFTEEGSFDAAAERLPHLVELGVTAVEVMPIANFPGRRNWGYDGVNLYAPATAYGDAHAFRRFVDRAHELGLGVILDVVYNHFGPEGNYLPAVTNGRFFTPRHCTPWGDGIDYDGPGSAPVREFVAMNALYWAREFHVDGLRLDATHAIVDDSPVHVIAEMAAALHSLPGHRRLLIAEDERNERGVVTPLAQGGWGLDAVWADDIHHQLRRLTAGDSEGYFAAYDGDVAAVVETLRRGWTYEGQARPDTGEARGTSASGIAPERFVHCIQNHDQVGNRAFGERLNHQVPLALYRAVSALLTFSPYTPLLWMGQEWAASSPFLYFTDHPEELGRLVTRGRREEFGHFSAFSDEAVRDTIPDPQAEETFARSRIDWDERDSEPHRGVLRLYQEMLRLRREAPALRDPARENWSVHALGEAGMAMRRRGGGGGDDLLLLVLFAGEIALLPDSSGWAASLPSGPWTPVLVTEEPRFGGSGSWGRIEGDGGIHLIGPVAAVLKMG